MNNIVLFSFMLSYLKLAPRHGSHPCFLKKKKNWRALIFCFHLVDLVVKVSISRILGLTS